MARVEKPNRSGNLFESMEEVDRAKAEGNKIRRYINVAYADRDLAKSLGAKWDASVRRWYCPPGTALAKIFSWRKL